MQKYKIDCYGYGTASLDNCSQFVLKVKCKDDEYGGMLLALVVAVVCVQASKESFWRWWLPNRGDMHILGLPGSFGLSELVVGRVRIIPAIQVLFQPAF